MEQLDDLTLNFDFIFPQYCKLAIINPDLTIKAQNLKYTNWEAEECVMHIKQLITLGAIQKSKHRSPFIVNKRA